MWPQEVGIPSFLPQPMGENAARRGADARGMRFVSVVARPTEEGFRIQISDRGRGFDPWVLEALKRAQI